MAKRKQLTMLADAYCLAPQDTRIAELRALGFELGALSLSGKRRPPSQFADICRSPTMVYHAGSVPLGSRIVPMWESASERTTVARRQNDGLIEIIDYSMEAPETIRIVAHHEQGILAHCFVQIIDLLVTCESDQQAVTTEVNALQKLAKRYGFKHFPDTVDLVGKGNPKPKDWLAFTTKAR